MIYQIVLFVVGKIEIHSKSRSVWVELGIKTPLSNISLIDDILFQGTFNNN